jgi:peptidoglycan hydrolase-like protein with peptidoglycan-binding domain
MNSQRLNVGDFGDDVARLHEEIRARGFEVSPEEVKRKFYGPATRDAVRECQTCHGLDVTGDVDEATAAMLIPVAGSPAHPIGATPRSPNESQVPALSSGRRTAFRPITPPLRRNDQGEDVINLQDCLQLMLEKQAIQASEEERRSFEEGLKREQEKQLYGDFTAKLIGRFQEQYSTRFHLAVTGETDAPTADALNSLLKELGATGPGQNGAAFEVKGEVASQLRAGVGGLRVEIVDKNVGEDVHLTETVTNVGGAYQATFPVIGLQERCKQRPDLQWKTAWKSDPAIGVISAE